CTVLLSTHNIEEAERLSDRIAIINSGKIIAMGTPRELLARLEKSYRLSYSETTDRTVVRHFGTFNDAQRYAAEHRVVEYSLARASLEDVYLELTGHRLELETFGEDPQCQACARSSAFSEFTSRAS